MNAAFDIEDRGLQYVGAARIEGPLVVVERIRDVGYDEVVEILDAAGHPRIGRVLDISETQAVVQVLEGTTGLSNRTLAGPLLRGEFSPPRLKADVGTRIRRPGPAGRRRPGRTLRGPVRCEWHADQPVRPALSTGIHTDGPVGDRRDERNGPRPEAADLFRKRPAP